MRSKLTPKGRAESRRVATYQAPPPSRLRRFAKFFINPWVVTFALVFTLIGFLSFTYFWFEFSDRIDRRLLSGEIYTPSAGIYSAPKTLKSGEHVTMLELIEYLKSAGYIEKNNKADQSRSRYSVIDGKLVIEPGITGVLDGKKIFPAISVSFAKDGKSVNGVADLEQKTQVEKIKLEPKMLSSTVAAEGDGRRRTVTFADIPPHLVKAITVTEDRAFFEHYGVNFRGIARALYRRYENEGEDSPIANQGGSSITQQLVKNLLLNNDPTLQRKATEAFMSVILETRVSKEDIFTLYANQIYLGQQSGVSIYGVGEAANVYFGKDVSQLTLGEAAFMAGIIRSPNRYGPYKNPERVEERRNQVIDSMLEAGEINAQQASDARTTKLVLKPVSGRKDLLGMPYFSQFAIEELPKVVADPEALQHYRVYTSIDPDLQRAAYQTMANRLDKLEKYFPKQPKGNLNGALVAIRPKTGEIVAMVGGRDFQQSQFNRATDAMRQPGSVFKPFVYATAINSAYDTASRVFTTATVFKDEKKIFNSGTATYAPNNYGDSFSNKETTLRDALVKSKNTITVDIGMQVNIGKVMNLANRAGMPKVERAYPSMALGTAEASPLNVASAYTMFANLGDRVAPMPITQVTQGDGTTVSAPQVDRKNVIRSDVAYIMDDMLKDVINRGTAAQAQGWGFKNVAGKTAFAGKTGTSRDGWFAGFTPELVCVVYVGFDDNDDLNMKGADSAMPIWADFMKEALQLHPEWNGDWSMPGNVRKAEIDIRTGLLIRELDALEVAETKPTPAASVSPTPTIEGLDDPAWSTDQSPELQENFATNVPLEFRRIELFVGGTVPPREMIDTSPPVYDDTGVSPEPEPEHTPPSDQIPPSEPTPSPPPLTNTWENLENRSNSSNPSRRSSSSTGDRDSVTVMVCLVTGMRATANCPYGEARTFQKGTEPKDFCTLHR
ncbi:MAG: PBP1A family penicillin-binding protein [Pyrinomonadaceae bacterium]